MSLKEQNVEKQSLSPTKFFSSKSQNINLDNKTNAKKIKTRPNVYRYDRVSIEILSDLEFCWSSVSLM